MTKTLMHHVPASLIWDAWWLDHDNRPFPPQRLDCKVVKKGATP